MRVLMVSDCYWPRVNGVSAAIKAVSNGLKGLGAEVCLIVPSYEANRGEVQRDSEEGIHLMRVPAPPFPMHPEDRMVVPTPSLLRNLMRMIAEFKPDIIHIHTPFGMGLIGLKVAKGLKVPSVFTYHTLLEDYVHYIKLLPKALLRRAARAYSRWFCHRVDLVISPSKGVKDKLLSYGVSKPIEILPSPINELFFSEPLPQTPSSLKEKLNIKDDEIPVVFVGRLGREKNVEAVIREFSKLAQSSHNLRLLIVGDGPVRKELEEEVKRLGLEGSVTFTGYLSQEEVKGLYELSEFFLFASKTETQGLVLAEAMARGVIPVVLRSQGVEDVLDGFELMVDSEGELANKLLQLLRSPATYLSSLKKRLKERASLFSPENISKRLLSIYEGLRG